MPTTNFNPTVIGGSIGVQGDVGTGPINQQAKGEATGGSFSLAIPMIPLQNLMTINNLRDHSQLKGVRTAIFATPEQAQALIRLNSQLENPYLVKAAYLI